MSTTPKLRFYLSCGDYSLVIPLLYKKYKNQMFTVTDATNSVKGYNKGMHNRLSNLNVVERVKIPITEKQKPPKWKIADEACVVIKRWLKENPDGDCQ